MANLPTEPQQKATRAGCQGVLCDMSQSRGAVVRPKADQSKRGDGPKVQVHNGAENMPPCNVLANEKSRSRTNLGDVSKRLPSERRGRNDKGKSRTPAQTNAAYRDAPEEGTNGPKRCTTKPPAGKPQVQATPGALSGSDASSCRPVTASTESATDAASKPARLGSDSRLAASVPTLAGSVPPALETAEDGGQSPAVGPISSSRVQASLALTQASALMATIFATALMAGAAVTDLGGYLQDIAGTLLEQEGCFWPQASYMAKQTELSSNKRGILVNWLVKVQRCHKLRHRTLYLTVNLVDRYLSRVVVTLKQLQLVGVAALFIAWKFEEVKLPDLQTLASITAGAYTQGDILRMEYSMLMSLSFRIAVPTYAHFLDFVLSACQCNAVQREFVQFLVELALLDVDMLRYLPSQLVLSAACLAKDLKCGEQAPDATSAANNVPAAVIGHIDTPTTSNVPVYAPRASASYSSCEAARATTCDIHSSEFSVWDDFTQQVNPAPASAFWNGDTRMVLTHEVVQQAARRSHVDQCKQELLALLSKAPTSSLQVVREKYMSKEHLAVAKLKFGSA